MPNTSENTTPTGLLDVVPGPLTKQLRGSEAIKHFDAAHVVSPSASIGSRYLTNLETGSLAGLKTDSQLHEHLKAVDEHAKTIKTHEEKTATTAPDALAAHQQAGDDIAKTGKKLGAEGHTVLDAHHNSLTAVGEDIEAARKAALEEVDKNLTNNARGRKNKLPDQQASKNAEEAKAKINEHADRLLAYREDASKQVEGHRAKITEVTGVSADPKALEVGGGAVASAGKAARSTVRPKYTEQKWKELTRIGRFKERLAYNFGEGSGFGKKAMRVGGAAVGVVIMLQGLRDAGRYVHVFEPKRDAEGKEVSGGFGLLVKSGAELGTGALVTLGSLTYGGQAKAVH